MCADALRFGTVVKHVGATLWPRGAVIVTVPFLFAYSIPVHCRQTVVRMAGSRPASFERERMRTLVLNAGYEPLAVVSFKRALVLVMNRKATMVQCDEGHPVWGASGCWERPSVILLTRYVRIPRMRVLPVSHRGVLRRDEHRCCYCGKSANTIDHVLPRSRGGRDTWDNLVACCLRCNNVKGDSTPAEMRWSMLFNPRMPQGATWVVRGIERSLPQWDEFLAPAA